MDKPAVNAASYADAVAGRQVTSRENGIIKLGSLIGEGSFGKVRTGFIEEKKMLVAVKIVKTVSSRMRSSAEMETMCMEQIEEMRWLCSSVPAFFDSFEIGKDCTCLVYELLGPTLSERAHIAHTNDVIKRIGYQLLDALDFLHQLFIAHCDVKLSNICSAQGNPYTIKLIDLGCARYTRFLRLGMNDNHICSVPYRPPEVLYGLPQSEKIDIWSAGVVLCNLFSGREMFPARDSQSLAGYQYSMRLVPKNIHKGQNYCNFFTFDVKLRRYRMLTNNERYDLGLNAFVDERKMALTCIRDIVKFGQNGARNPVPNPNDPDDNDFVWTMRRLLAPDADRRPTAEEALNLPYFSGFA